MKIWLAWSEQSWLRRCISLAIWSGCIGLCAIVVNVAALFLYLNPQLPDASTYRSYSYETPLRILSKDGELLAEFGERRLMPMLLEDAPELYLQAVIATEDKRFYSHDGIDWISLANDVIDLILNPEVKRGASTITMQLPRNVADLSRGQTVIRKAKEMLLAMKIERELTKDEILELYINVVPFGKRAYGIQAASYIYYNKSPHDLDIAQVAMLAGVPKRPEAGNPINGPEWAIDRRNLVLRRMRDSGLITFDEYEEARSAPITAQVFTRQIDLHSPYPAEIARQEVFQLFGEEIYSGYAVVTTIDLDQQAAAQEALRKELEAYDRTYGYRGREASLDIDGERETLLASLSEFETIHDQVAAVVKEVGEQSAKVLIGDGSEYDIPWEGISWARRALEDTYVDVRPETADEVFDVGDVVRVRQSNGSWELAQIPEVTGALVAMDPNSGEISALVGGYSFKVNQFNHATQLKRQPGSGFKPFVYSAALNQGITPATVFMDAPLVFEDASLEGVYRPRNDGGTYRGPTRLREALFRSVNLVSIRVFTEVGGNHILSHLPRFGIEIEDVPHSTQLAIGGGNLAFSPLEMATAYSVFANGGYRVQPHLIHQVTGRDGSEVYAPVYPSVCEDCEESLLGTQASVSSIVGSIESDDTDPVAPRVLDERNTFLMNSMLRDVVKRGTARRALQLGRDDLAGKTGTTDEAQDTWFNGFHPDLVATTWVGFPNMQTLGRYEFGSTRPLSIWIEFMRSNLPDLDERQLEQPEGIVRVRIDESTGQIAAPSQEDAIFEYFRVENSPARGVGDRRTMANRDLAPEDIF